MNFRAVCGQKVPSQTDQASQDCDEANHTWSLQHTFELCVDHSCEDCFPQRYINTDQFWWKHWRVNLMKNPFLGIKNAVNKQSHSRLLESVHSLLRHLPKPNKSTEKIFEPEVPSPENLKKKRISFSLLKSQVCAHHFLDLLASSFDCKCVEHAFIITAKLPEQTAASIKFTMVS